MFKFYEILAGHDMVTDAGRATKCKRKFKGPSIPTKSTKIEGPSENMIFNRGKSLKISDEKKEQKHYSQPFKKPSGLQGP